MLPCLLILKLNMVHVLSMILIIKPYNNEHKLVAEVKKKNNIHTFEYINIIS